jgi:hypothetical protein
LLERWVEGLGVVGVGADEAVEEARLEARDDLQKPIAIGFVSSFLLFTPGVYSREPRWVSPEPERTALQGEMSVGERLAARNRRIESILMTAI